MLRGIYTAASAMNAIQLSTDTMANNLANVSTSGFKTQRVDFESFPMMLMQRMEKDGSRPEIGTISSGVQVESTPVYFSQGSLQKTDNPLDMAIEGDALFTVEGRNGQPLYTRNGSFTLNEHNEMVTTEGLRVLDTSGEPIVIPNDAGELFVGKQGQLSSQKLGDIAQVGLVTFSNPTGLQKISDTLFYGEKPQPLASNNRSTVQQGFLEQSNTNVVQEMLNSITGTRLYETLQKQITQQNQTLGKAVNEIGKPN